MELKTLLQRRVQRIITQSNESLQREKTDIKALFNSRVDGMLISVSRETNSFEHIEGILAKGVPMVFFDRVYENANSSMVIVDDLSGAKEATQHLIEQGCKRIAHLEGPPNLGITKQRLEGYVQALTEANIPVLQELIVSCPLGTIEEGKSATQQLMKMSNPPDAIFATNDPAAMGAMQAIKEAGLKIPKDIAVVGLATVLQRIARTSVTSVDRQV